MRLIFKILAVPVVLVLTLTVWLCAALLGLLLSGELQS